MDAMERALLEKIGEARFACVELRLYLDTHPDDAMAKADYLAYSMKLQQLIERYEQQYGPLMNFGQSPTEAGSWVFQKWPWEL
ncbi:MAG: spore coat protein CotJB [bacterium]|nr:spore coat protein CotJB [bacterium]